MESLLGEGGLLPAVCGARRLYVRSLAPLPGKEQQAEREDRGGLGPPAHDATVAERRARCNGVGSADAGRLPPSRPARGGGRRARGPARWAEAARDTRAPPLPATHRRPRV